MNVQNKVFLVTGASGGIGSQLVSSLLSRGASVAAVDLKEEGLQKLHSEHRNASDRLATFAVDITDKAAVENLPQQIEKNFAPVDSIINCAGIIQPFIKVNDLAYADIDRVMKVNFYGTLYMIKSFLPHLLDRPEGYIVNVSSMGGFLPVPGQSVYGASKAAVKLLTEGLYAELLDTSVHVSVAFPGATDTNITANSGVKTPSSNSRQQYNMLSATDAAEIIVKGIEKNKPQIFTGKDSTMMNRLYRLNPVGATKLIAKQMKSLLAK
ncbi:short-chain dehydrogenase [Candidatus Saccharibacteria bacterium]|nr:short-chain dehydrogenase [Candidatus Saccharibacteria bacterium]MBQ68675.1 short-chain dehydrogenase [Candidatus Saccharibacteria bacterium]|tara:strand:+ start:265 stop:1065 length:801 start_codon:yes stop_codon:yes gene_type:complete